MIYKLNGKEISREEFRKNPAPGGFTVPMTAPNGNWPMTGEIALSIHPSQLEEYTKSCIANGVPTEFKRTSSGLMGPVLRDKAHYRQYCEAHGFWSRNAGHSCPKRD